MATINDVAKKAGVSTATVSHVINNSRFVTDGTRQRVLDAVRSLNYRRDGVARSLRRSQTGSIGLMISDIANPFFPDIVRGAEDMARSRGYNLILCNTDENAEKEQLYLDVLLEKRVDGILMTPTGGNQQYLLDLLASAMPIAFVDRWLPGIGVDAAVVDNEQAAYNAVSHLIALGHRRIAVVEAELQSSAIAERLDGYCRALAEAAIPFDPRLMVTSRSDIEAGLRVASRLLAAQPRPSAVFGTNNLVTLGLMQAIVQLELRCPEDVAVVGFDDFPWATAFHPALTTVAQPSYALGQTATKLLLRRIARRQDEPEARAEAVQREVLPARLVVRESCGQRLGQRVLA